MNAFVVPLDAPEAIDAGRFGPKAANQAVLARVGLPTAGGFCVDAAAYRAQIAHLGLEQTARTIFATDGPEARRAALAVRLGLMEQPIAPEILGPLLFARRMVMAMPGTLCVVRSSALVEDRFGSSFAGQFESYLGLASEADFLTAVRACWAALWSTRALRYMATHDLDPADTAMAVIIQPLVAARTSGGGLSKTANGGMLLSATWGLGSTIAQGEVVPDCIELGSDGQLHRNRAGRKHHREGCIHGHDANGYVVAHDLAEILCLDESQATTLGALLLKAQAMMGMPVEIEWAMDNAGFKLLQARPLHLEQSVAPNDLWEQHPRLSGQPAGVGWSSGRACVVNCECELNRVGQGDILVTKVAGPALSHVLPLVGGVVAELGGSTSHLAALARERGLPMVLGVLNATQHVPDGAMVAVDGVAGVVRWIR